MSNVIEVKNLIKKYENFTAVNDISFEVRKGEIFGLLGENGAGKTTTLEIIEGLRKATSGTIKILDHDVSHGCPNIIKERIGVQLQSSSYYHYLTLREIIDLFGSFYRTRMDAIELLAMVDLVDKKDSLVSKLSGGQKQRFSIAASLLNKPEIIFLDEPTTGLDPSARRNLWNVIGKIKNQGTSVILTTHYMDEAEVLCDRIAIMSSGKILTIGETHKLIESSKHPFKIIFVAPNATQLEIAQIAAYGKIGNLAGKSNHFEIYLQTQEQVHAVLPIIEKLKPETITIGRASLENLFIDLTGKNIEE